MAESRNAKSFIKSRPDQTQPVDRVSGGVHIDGKTGLTLAAQFGRAEGGEELFPGPALLRKPYRNMADQSNNAKSANKSRPGQSQTVDRVSDRDHVDGETGSAAAARKGKKADGESSKFSNAPAHKWNIPMVPKLRGIDERAEEFIAKFRQDMKLEREQSILDYEEMLKRSA